MCCASTTSSTYLLYVAQTKSTLSLGQASVIGATGEDSCRSQQPEHSLCAPTLSPTQAALSTSAVSVQTCARYCGTAPWRTRGSSAPPNSPPMPPCTAALACQAAFLPSGPESIQAITPNRSGGPGRSVDARGKRLGGVSRPRYRPCPRYRLGHRRRPHQPHHLG